MALLSFALSGGAQAQGTQDPQTTVYATGAVFETAEELADKPRTLLFRAFLPEHVDLRDRFPVARHQGRQSSCVGWAVGYAARSYYNSSSEGGPGLTADRIPSPAYIYDSIRSPGDACDRGTKISDALDLLVDGGSLTHAEYPYDEDLCRRPGTDDVARASKFRIAGWQVVDTDRLDQVKAELANGHPVVIGMRPNRDFHRLRGSRIWRAGFPNEDDGHHAVTVVGYSERGQYFTVMNSWGPGWGLEGFGHISYDTFEDRVKYGFSMRMADTPVAPKPEPPSPKPAPPVTPSPVVPELKLPAVGCGRLKIEEQNGKTLVRGFIGNRDDLTKVRKAAEQSKAHVEVKLRPWPQCETLMTIEKPLAHPDKPSFSLPKRSYRASETLGFEVRMSGFQGYLHVAYLQADGTVVNLVESDPLTLSTLPANAKLRFGDGLAGRQKFTVGEPFGNEMIVALASKSPLFAEDRPLVETEREFLTALRRAIIARPDPTQPERVVSAGFVALETKPGE
ncbi:MAG: C39 family peptidase [Deltaproteobacteria bacterium]|nr:C39 family peptidase [Deltaproteobacteria bacterium]